MEKNRSVDPMFTQVLKEQQFVEVPVGVSRAELNAIVTSFLRFLDEVPDTVKRTLHFKSPFHRGSADGYSDKRNVWVEEHTNDVGICVPRHQKDPKEFFHLGSRLNAQPVYKDALKKYPALYEFHHKMEQVYRKSERVVLDLFLQHFPDFLPYISTDEGKSIENAVLRVLAYTPTPGALHAKGHYDKSVGTLALGESSSGLRIGCCEEHGLKPVVHKERTGLFMPGILQWELAHEEGHPMVIPSWHDVVQATSTPDISERCARWAIVFFFDHKDGRYPEWDSVHGFVPHKREGGIAIPV